MTDQAWPFLIGRTHTEDHRVIVAPGFLTGRKLAAALRSQADGDPCPPGVAYLRELAPDPGASGIGASAPGEPVTIVYRVLIPARSDFGLPGTTLLTDEHGRPIRMTEGIVLRQPARAIAAAGVLQADLDRARAAVVPAYLEFWGQGRRFHGVASAPFRLTASGGATVRLTAADGSALADGTAAASATPGSRAAPPRATAPGATGAEVADCPVSPPGSAPALAQSGRRLAWLLSPASLRTGIPARTAAVALAAIVTVAAMVGFWLSGTARPAATPGAVLADLCDALLSGRPAAAYALTTVRYRRRTDGPEFAGRLLPAARGRAVECTGWLAPGSPRGTARATLVIAQRRGPAVFWQVRLAGRLGSWQVAGLARQ
jgi:hypothetical protein